VFGAGLAPGYGAPKHEYPKHNCTVAQVKEDAETCTPTFTTVCKDVTVAVKRNATLSHAQSALSLSRPSPMKSVCTHTYLRILKLRPRPSQLSTPPLVSHRWSPSVTQDTNSMGMDTKFTAKKSLRRLATTPHLQRHLGSARRGKGAHMSAKSPSIISPNP
jgi:hypothetical protein